jgi:hypothetical protein
MLALGGAGVRHISPLGPQHLACSKRTCAHLFFLLKQLCNGCKCTVTLLYLLALKNVRMRNEVVSKISVSVRRGGSEVGLIVPLSGLYIVPNNVQCYFLV